MKFKNRASSIIFTLLGFELNVETEYYGLTEQFDETMHFIIAEVFYCDIILDAKILVTELYLNEFIKKYNLTIKAIVDKNVYFNISEEQLKNLRKEKFDLKWITTLYSGFDEEDEDEWEDEDYIFRLMISKSVKSFTQ